MRVDRVLPLGFALLLLASGATYAQEEPEVVVDPELAPPTMGTASYEAAGRRDPFVPLTTELAEDEGPRFDSLTLTGVFLGTPGNSLVVLEDPANRGHFLRVGQSIGDARLIEIRPQSAVFQITEYGTTRRKILELERTGEQP